MPHLKRRFDWDNTERIYLGVDEDKCESLGKGKFSFVARDLDGKEYISTAYEATVGDMCDHDYWRIQRIPNRKDPTKTIAIVVSAKPPLPKQENPSNTAQKTKKQ